jgi:hypothetical protein
MLGLVADPGPPTLLPEIGGGPPQATKAAAARTATPQGRLVRLMIRDPVMLTSLNVRAVNRVSPKEPTQPL